ncbi:MAG: carboxypeptidase regulatory-like domain-containing protein [Bryobacter sp.]|nr:carboxypeptidase regulatory-like domain-containing protein [Bryobacter sp.]
MALLLLIATGVGLEAQVSGRVVNALTGEGVGRASLNLTKADEPEGRPVARTNSDASGAFAFENVLPGEYILVADKPGYARPQSGNVETNPSLSRVKVKLHEREAVRGITIKLAQAASLTGVVLDAQGEPARDAMVFLWRTSETELSDTDLAAEPAHANEKGEFRFHSLPEGEYLLAAVIEEDRNLTHEADSLFKTRIYRSVLTYFPGTFDRRQATKIHLAAGSEGGGLTLTLKRVPLFHLSGQFLQSVDHKQDQSNLVASLTRQEKNTIQPLGELSTYAVTYLNRHDKSFHFEDLLPGDYTLHILAGRDPVQRVIGMQDVTIDEADVEISIAAFAPRFVSGRVRWEQHGTALEGNQYLPKSLGLRLLNGYQATRSADVVARVAEDGTFQFEGVAPAEYLILINQPPKGTKLQKVLKNGIQVDQHLLDLREGGDLELVFSPTPEEEAMKQ